MRSGGNWSGVRASALWGNGKRGTGSRSNALWGNGKRRTALLATLVLTLVVPLGASAVPGPKVAQAFVADGGRGGRRCGSRGVRAQHEGGKPGGRCGVRPALGLPQQLIHWWSFVEEEPEVAGRDAVGKGRGDMEIEPLSVGTNPRTDRTYVEVNGSIEKPEIRPVAIHVH